MIQNKYIIRTNSINKACITTYHERKVFNKNRDYVTYIPFMKKAELF
ncbi:hypothetical protein ACSW8Q_15915 (plasmid) [Clostridium perfringens]|nr:hypothetical protein [Clostridium perfringens]ELC8464118.1 hypothetical protein [Clostridium perfringens]MDT7988927.1 hypothetical protein [Clostridium perfringens]WVM62203.1 hypothetical protein V1657_15485 [Clostridium perfringens]